MILEEYDLEHSTDEERVRSVDRGVIVVISTERDDGNIIRLITARFSSRFERQRYAAKIAGVEP